MLGASFANLLMGAWVTAQGDHSLLGPETNRKLTEVYARIQLYNDAVSGWDYNTQTRDPINKEANALKLLMQESVKLLEQES